MFYIVWLITAFVAVGAGCLLSSIVDKKNPSDAE
jgi:hypothetical protein